LPFPLSPAKTEVGAIKNASSKSRATGWRISSRRGGPGGRASSLALLLAVSLAGTSGMAHCQTGKQAAPPLAITVRVYTFTRVSPADLAAAENVASGIFRWTGVKLTWIDCPQTSREARQNPACQFRIAPTEIAVRITADLPELAESVVGYSVPIPPSQHGYLAGIDLERVKEHLREAPELTLGELLGLSIAHEIGHLLLGTQGHSSSGLMQARWGARELQLAVYGLLNFSPRQAAAIRADVQARLNDNASQQRIEVGQASPFLSTAR